MSREQDKAKAKELLKNLSIRKIKKDTERLKKVRQKNEESKNKIPDITPTNYSESLSILIPACEVAGFKSDVKFLKSLPDGDDAVFINLPE